MRRAVVVTTIHPPTRALALLAEGCTARNWPLVVAGDDKSPGDFRLLGAHYLDVEEQAARFPRLAELAPTGSYARKNFGYLAAMTGAEDIDEIQETDDDNLPRDGFWAASPERLEVTRVAAPGWFNVYSLFTDELVWPRGFPLERVAGPRAAVSLAPAQSRGLVQAGLADGDPDVDAVYRLTRKLPIHFGERAPVLLAPGTWCPFNSQNLRVKRAAFALLYLPSFCTVRVTDIWRSFVMQRCLWETGEGVVHHSATVVQERNPHDLLRDLELEVPGYVGNEHIRALLAGLRLGGDDPPANLYRCYRALVARGFIPAGELPLVRAWCRYVESAS